MPHLYTADLSAFHFLSRWVARAGAGLLAGGLLWSGSLSSAHAQSDSLRTLDRQLSRYSQQRLPEKLFLHVDRPFYVSGEIMWFKVYAVDGVQHKPLMVSKVAYVELLDREQKPVLQGKIKLLNAAGQGTFVLPKSLASGTYTVRAYTNWMKNFPPEYYFHSTITVVNTFGSVTKAAPTPTTAGTDAQFFPEGGHLVKGLTSTVAFQVTDQRGQGVAASGIIVDQRGRNVAQLSTLKFGLGSFAFTPTETGASYSAILQLPNNQTLTRKLPAVQEQGYVLHLASTANGLSVTVQTTVAGADDILLLGHARQQPFVATMGRFRDNKAVFTLDKKDLPEGIAHFTVFNAARKPLCERLYFTPPTQQLTLRASTDKKEYSVREKVSLQLSAAGPGARPLPANASVAVYRLDSLSAAAGTSINSYLWLASDLKGRIENPDYYFSANSAEVAQAADNLMLTQGWSRFRWADVVGSSRPAPAFYPETSGHWIQGKLTHRGTGQAAPGIPVYLASPSRQPRLYSSISQPDGRVQFDMRDFYGPKEIVVQTNTQVDSTYQVEVYSPFSTAYAPTQQAALQLPESLRPELAQRHLQAQVQTAYFKKFTNQYALSQTDSLPFYGKPSEQYMLDAYTRFKVMEEVMREYVPGVLVRIRKGQFHFQVIDHLNNQPMTDDPLVLLDGVPVFNINKVVALDPLKIQKLDVITSRYFHGRQIHQGLVSYTTYKGDLGSYKLDAHALLQEYEGLQRQREFYSPRYDTPQAQQSRLPDFRNLLYWNPQVTTTAAGPSALSFYTADQPGKYVVVVQGLSTTGLAGSYRTFLQVKSAL
ncbi:hypothetical protein [Hymenobacter cellulosilyticus]|uniref:Macroglobulin domain-containing protein n=1 Tax=Hymenobacter cellulosilyticus TaxID=2932248 RepID=A0A8T9Q4B4_9BACT|nr:hypothetical protein [Hymenobacter cellulosilyticus]UOQ71271.1 hypothetical protein MUN79_21880 [Hymenobacter cellulosilyticus]